MALFPASHVVVVGGGFTGMVLANQVLERGGRVLVRPGSHFGPWFLDGFRRGFAAPTTWFEAVFGAPRLEKAPFCGGNSVKATAGMNFARRRAARSS